MSPVKKVHLFNIVLLQYLPLVVLVLLAATPSRAAELPVIATPKQPLLLLEAEPTQSVTDSSAVKVFAGIVSAHAGDDYVAARASDVIVAKKGYANTLAVFRYNLGSQLKPGRYAFWARYQLGGDQPQNFIITSGPNEQDLAQRASTQLRNPTAWKSQWIRAKETVNILPGDVTFVIQTEGKASDAKVFDAFLLQPFVSFPGDIEFGVSPTVLQTPQDTRKKLYVLDAGGPDAGAILFRGLTSTTARFLLSASMDTINLIGKDAKQMAERLNVASLPAAIITDANGTVIDILVKPSSEEQVIAFLGASLKKDVSASDQSKPSPPQMIGITPLPVPSLPPPQSLRNGVPQAWLVGGIWAGLAGYSTYGLNAELTLRPNPGDEFVRQVVLTDYLGAWVETPTAPDGKCIITSATDNSYVWTRGTAYVVLYLQADKRTQAVLHLQHTGVGSAGWLDSKPLTITVDANPPADFPQLPITATQGRDQGGVVSSNTQLSRAISLDLQPGWHRLLIKLLIQHDKGKPFDFQARFTDATGKPINSVKTQLYDPNVDIALHRNAARLEPLFYLQTPGNLAWPGESLKVRIVLASLQKKVTGQQPKNDPVLPFKAKLYLRFLDYSGKLLLTKQVISLFPGEVLIDLGKAPQTGFYALRASLYTPEGRLITEYPADGFSVVGGAVTQRERIAQKKLWSNYYFVYSGHNFYGDKKAYNTILPWMERMGILHNMGSHPGFQPEMWDAAKRAGVILTGDFTDPQKKDEAEEKAALAAKIAPYTKYFKSYNEMDINKGIRPTPKQWVEMTRWDYEAVKSARADSLYGGASLVRPAAADVIDWFAESLELGLDNYLDRWDVHAYPQNPPVLEGRIANSDSESDQGVLNVYKKIGRENKLLFWLGETGALPWHGVDGLRWQAETTAKIAAWVNSRSDFELAAFCAAFAYTRELPSLWEFSLGHRPAEAALYTASALIDGLPYQRVQMNNKEIQAAYFGDTFMIWTTGQPTLWQMRLEPSESWLVVDVVGRTRVLVVRSDGVATIPVTSSPLYVLKRQTYNHLTRF